MIAACFNVRNFPIVKGSNAKNKNGAICTNAGLAEAFVHGLGLTGKQVTLYVPPRIMAYLRAKYNT